MARLSGIAGLGAVLAAAVCVVLGCNSSEPAASDPPTRVARVAPPVESSPAPESEAIESEPAQEPAEPMPAPETKLNKEELDLAAARYRAAHGETSDDEPDRGGSEPRGTAEDADSLFGPAGPNSIEGIMSLITAGADPEAYGSEEKGLVSLRFQGTDVDLKYFRTEGSTPGPKIPLPGETDRRTRYAIEGYMPESVVSRMLAMGGASRPDGGISDGELAVIVDAESVVLKGDIVEISSEIEERASGVRLVPQSERGVVVFQSVSEPTKMVWLHRAPGSGHVQATLITVGALPEPMMNALAALAIM